MSPLKATWSRQALAEISTVVLGQSPPGASYNVEGEGTPFFQGKAEFGALRPTVRKYTTAGTKFAAQGDILLSVRAPVGPTNLAPVACAVGRGLVAIRAHESVDQRYLLWALRATEDSLASKGAGSTFQAVTGAQVRAHRVNVAPTIAEQRRIVEILEDHLSHLDAADSSLGMAVKRLPAVWSSRVVDLLLPGAASSVLADEPARLGESDPPDVALPAGWRWARWSEVGICQNGKAFPSRAYQDSGVRLLRPGNLGSAGSLIWTDRNTKWLPENYRESHAGVILGPGDLVMNLTAQSLADDFLGRACIVGPGEVALLNQRIARLRANGIAPEYSLVVFRSSLFRHYVKSLSTGSLIQHMFTKQVDRFWLPVPPPSVQRRIIQESAILQESGGRLASVIGGHSARSVALRRAVLAAAFQGKLTGRHTDTEVIEEMASSSSAQRG